MRHTANLSLILILIVVHAGPAAYSNLVKLPEGRVGLLYEKGESHRYDTITFETFPITRLEDDPAAGGP